MLICISVLISFWVVAKGEEPPASAKTECALTVWQIDSFEGGKGSRADYLRDLGKEFALQTPCYINVYALSSDAARMNLNSGNIPDIISFGAGMYGIENIISNYSVWARGGYCLLTLDGDFSDIDAKNTVINKGRDNLSSVAALFLSLEGARTEIPTNAYLKLLSGEYKYLLGTQRDIYRLKTRKAAFKVKGITEFNDLYQSIAITSACKEKDVTKEYINFLLSKSEEVQKIGMFSDKTVYDDEMKELAENSFDCKLVAPISQEVKGEIEKYVQGRDINMLKTLFN